MVATLLSLRWASLRHNLRREPWRAVLLGAGLLWAVLMIPSAAGAVAWLGGQTPDVSGPVVIVAGTLITLGWAVVPVAVPSLDDTLDIDRFAAVGVQPGRLVPGLLASTALGLPTLLTAAVTLVPALGWWAAGATAAAVVALLAAPLALLTCLVAARLSTFALRRLLATRTGRRGAALAGLGVVLVVALGVRDLARLGLEGSLERLPDAATTLGWTPLAAAWAAPAAAAVGDLPGAGLRLVIAAATGVAGAWWWGRMLHRWLVDPPPTTGRVRRGDTMLPRASGRKGRRTGRGSGLDAAGAIARRGWRSWTTDPRYLASLVAGVVFPLAIVVLAVAVTGERTLAVAAGVLIAGSVGWGRHNDVAYDGTAFWLHVTAAVPGWADRLGRAAATALWAAPLVVTTGAAGALVAGRADLVPAAVGAALGVLGAGLAASAMLSSLLPYPVPGVGDNPFTAQTGAVGAGIVAQLVSITVTTALITPVAWLFGVTVVARPELAWVTGVAGAVVGAGALAAGVVLGGMIHDARAVRILARLG